MTLSQFFATHAANEYINYHCQQVDMLDRLLIWQQVYDTTLAALTCFEHELQDRRQDAMAQASLN